ncbi:MAG: proton-translocating transhydrogenase family protein [Cyanobacteria bacterium]|nr:proton-translocating transhydrogenase family protein [Cyanobacteriota bacterium]MDW8199970.1 proton-translocating transhydrogenase family protein [Cyanobacteriota bacterium SKYGB_h_bin112]
MALFAEQAKDVDIIITTALIPGVKAPVLITREMVESMKDGSVIVDMAAEQGGNCELTKPGEAYRYQGVTIIGYTDLPSRMAQQASQLYGTNLYHFLDDLGGAANYHINRDDEIVAGALLTYQGEVTWSPNKPKPAPSPQPVTNTQQPVAVTASTSASSNGAGKTVTTPIAVKVEAKPTQAQSATAGSTTATAGSTTATEPQANGDLIWLVLAGIALTAIGLVAPSSFLSHFTVFVLACFVGWQVIWNVKPALHTPLMSVTNAISGIIIIGGILQISGSFGSPTTILGAIAILIGTINISGGFLVTQRMLKMFQK